MNKEKNYTAVELLFQEMLEIQQSGLTLSFDENIELLEKYKEMFKEQMIKAHGEDRSYLQDDGSWKRTNGEQYYNETFGGNNEQQ